MKQIFTDVKTGEILIMELPSPACKKDGILVRTRYSLVSAGTEKTLIDFGKMNLLQKAKTRPDQIKKAIDKMQTDGLIATIKTAFNKLDEPLPLGYSAMGEVIEVGGSCDQFQKGDYVAIAGALYANHAEINYVPRNLAVKLPSTFQNLEHAAFVALGAIALQGIKQAEVQSGEKVAVIGLGLLGQITCQVLNAYSNTVIGIDIDDSKYIIGKQYINHFINAAAPDLVERTNYLTNSYGVDKIIITAATETNDPIEIAAEIARDRSIISMVGVTKMDIPRRSFYQKELTFKLSRSYGPGRYDSNYEEKGIDYPIGYVRWTENRLMEEFIRLLSEGKLHISDLISHRFSLEEARDAYELITEKQNKKNYSGILFEYCENTEPVTTIVRKEPKKVTGTIGVGIIGVGNFARSVIIPNLKKIKDFRLIGMATTSSTTAGQTLRNHQFDYSTSDYKRLLSDPTIDLIIIATQHDSHAQLATESLDAGKHVYVEKPLAITEEQLESVKVAYERNQQHLFVGFNRRFSPFARFIKENMQTDKHPCIIQYTVNAGYIPKKNWIQSPEKGGGRLIGEVCHFVDLSGYFTESTPIDKSLFSLNSLSIQHSGSDNLSLTLKYANGSVANIIYTSMGAKSYPKERINVFCNGMVGRIDNFHKAEIYGKTKKRLRKLQQDKGFSGEYEYIVDCLLKGKFDERDFENAYETTRVVL
ncbi:MAG TPA: bi-domain-containing oxidoreductase [Thermotogota bacterium]|jgi:predicted dehydrogenase/threonine dehydrogenase-like Zn-dependent dehydrogenase|nr:bi-domain-containing oxidoreductase [Thermotogota bacterium]HOS23894.1 bi-domain-containing oxidoreductase [Thermotogota bacterium]HOT87270.1 bi-domain-containing oxidoreductase [Thermotogota bacterium]HPD36466.1 bi-domain-containing oxidoreductase [Thermotogota bacterium]HPL37765.1 bi-domain-containing oxidoreductase [Thermotogota bacterium]